MLPVDICLVSSPSPSSHISYIAIPHLLCRHIHTCCPTYPTPCLSAAVSTADPICHTHYPGATRLPQVGSCSLSIFAQSVLHIRRPTYHLFLSHISSAVVSIPVVLHIRHRSCPPLYSPLTLSAIPTSRVFVTVLIVLYSIVLCTSPSLFFYLLRSYLLLDLRCSELHFFLCSDPH